MKPAAKRSTLSWARLMGLMIALAGLASCAETHWHVSPKPIEAVLEIRVGNQWQMIKRERYVYESDAELSGNWASLPLEELERLERQWAHRDDAMASALRVLIEQRKAGLKEK